MKRVAEECEAVYIKYHKGLSSWKDCMGLSEKRDFKTKVIVLIGRPGTGKSRLANEISKYVYEDKSHDKRWWDGCDEETECVIIDDFYGLLKYDELLKITDRYLYKGHVKGACQL